MEPTPVEPQIIPVEVMSAGSVMTRGFLFPGLAQFSTGRKGLGSVFMLAAGAGIGMALYGQDSEKTESYQPPFGDPIDRVVTETSYPLRAAGIALTAVSLLAGGIEGYLHQQKVIATYDRGPGPGDQVSLELFPLPDGRRRPTPLGSDLSLLALRF